MASRSKRKRKSTDSQPAEMPAVATTDTFQSTTPSSTQDVESMVRACMAAIIPTTEETCREIITRQSELPSAATRSGPAATVTASSIPEDTSAEGSHYGLQPAQSLLQDITEFFNTDAFCRKTNLTSHHKILTGERQFDELLFKRSLVAERKLGLEL